MSKSWSGEELSSHFHALPAWGKVAVGAGVGLALYIPYKYLTSRPRKSPYKEDFEPGVVYLYQFPRAKNVPNVSNFCLKLETWLRMADINYEIVKIPLYLRSKEGTLPFVELDGREYHDSAFIVRDLMVALNKTSMEEHLTEEQKALCRAFEKMIELSFNVSHMPCRLEHVKEIVSTVPAEAIGVLYPIVHWLMQNTMAANFGSILAATGYGKHSRDEQIQIGCDDLKAISTYLGSKHYFTGFKPTRIDACLFAFLSQIVFAPYDNEHTAYVQKECRNLVEYVERIKTRLWPDWVECTTKFSTDSHKKRRGHGGGASHNNSLQHSPNSSLKK